MAHTDLVPVELPGYRLLHQNYVVQYASDPDTGLPIINPETGQPVLQLVDRSSTIPTQ